MLKGRVKVDSNGIEILRNLAKIDLFYDIRFWRPDDIYKMIQEYVKQKYGFKVHTAYIAEVKKALGITMYSAPNATEELKQTRKRPPKEKVDAITEALTYFEVI